MIKQRLYSVPEAVNETPNKDKPTGSVVGHQLFGGSRGSGTNDKAGSILNLQRWVSPRTIKESFLPPEDYRYPHLEDD